LRAKVRRIQFCHAFCRSFLDRSRRLEEFWVLTCPVVSDHYVMRLLRAGGLDVTGLLAAVADALLSDLRRAVTGKVTGLAA
jgi:hypothetical protein